MTTWTSRAHELKRTQAQQLAHVLTTTDTTHLEKTFRTTAGGDTQKLRGIPAIGRGVQGCIPGTNPGGTIR